MCLCSSSTSDTLRCSCGYKECSDCWANIACLKCPQCKKQFDILVVDIGKYRTKCGTYGSSSPFHFLSITTATVDRHRGIAASLTEEVGENALLSTYSTVDQSINRFKIFHFIFWSQQVCSSNGQVTTGRNSFSGKGEVMAKIKIIICGNFPAPSGYIPAPYSELVETIKSGIIVDFCYEDTVLYAVENNKLIKKTVLDFGGVHVSSFLAKMMQACGRNFQYKPISNEVYTGVGKPGIQGLRDPIGYLANKIKEINCTFPANLQEAMKKEGYSNWRDNLRTLHGDKETLFSCLPSDIITSISKCTFSDTNILEQMGWFSSNPEPAQSGAAYGYNYKIGAEKFLALEFIFQPTLIGQIVPNKQNVDLIAGIRSLYEASQQKKIILCGGMTACPGIAERIKKELSEDFEVTVEEHFMWNACNVLVKNSLLKNQ